MSNVERLQLPTPEEGLQNQRASVTRHVHDLTRTGGQSLTSLPHFIKQALQVEAWKDRTSPLGRLISNKNFAEWLSRPYPDGVGASVDLIRKIIADDNEALILFDKAIAGGHGGAHNPHGRAGKPAGEIKSDNILLDKDANSALLQYGTSKDAGLRRLRKAAEAGDDQAADLLKEVKTPDPEKPGRFIRSVNSACQAMGWRPKIDRDVQQRAADALADWIIEHANGDDLDAVKANAFACGAKALGIALTNRLGESIMDRRYGGRS